MQTFLPSNNFSYCAKVLDNKRLFKQNLENIKILKLCLDNLDRKLDKLNSVEKESPYTK